MGKLAELAKTDRLKGKVTVTLKTGVTHLYENEEEAEAACAGLCPEHKRGAFFEAAQAPKAPEPPVILIEDEPAPPKRSKKKARKKSSESS